MKAQLIALPLGVFPSDWCSLQVLGSVSPAASLALGGPWRRNAEQWLVHSLAWLDSRIWFSGWSTAYCGWILGCGLGPDPWPGSQGTTWEAVKCGALGASLWWCPGVSGLSSPSGTSGNVPLHVAWSGPLKGASCPGPELPAALRGRVHPETAWLRCPVGCLQPPPFLEDQVLGKVQGRRVVLGP